MQDPEYTIGGYKYDYANGVRYLYKYCVICTGCGSTCKGEIHHCETCKDKLIKPCRKWEVVVSDIPEPIPGSITQMPTETKASVNVNEWNKKRKG